MVRGYLNGNFGPDDRVQRAQMAALIAAPPRRAGHADERHTIRPRGRAGTWDCEDWGNSFTDRGGIVASLWRDAGAPALASPRL
ncbi:MAG: S-layer homology domain-containing protein [Chloroflexia bacterium]